MNCRQSHEESSVEGPVVVEGRASDLKMLQHVLEMFLFLNEASHQLPQIP